MPEEVDNTLKNVDVINKYNIAGDITNRVLAKVKGLAVPGAKIIDICTKGDEFILAETNKIFKGKNVSKGIGFPTSVSPNSCVAHLSPLPTDKEAETELKEGDLVKITLGAQIDGFASCAAETIVVGNAEVTDELADAISAGWYATEAALRTLKPGKKNWDVTKVVEEVTKVFDCTPLEGMLSNELSKNTFDGKKRIILNPSESQKKDFETVTFEEGEVYGLDILVTPGDGKTKQLDTQTTIYKKTDITYQLKLTSSRATFSEIQKKAGAFPFTLRTLEDIRKAKMGLIECVSHNLVIPFDVYYSKDNKPVVQFFTTVGLTKNGSLKFAGANEPDFSQIKSSKQITDEKLLELLKEPLKKPKKQPAKKE